MRKNPDGSYSKITKTTTSTTKTLFLNSESVTSEDKKCSHRKLNTVKNDVTE